MRVTVIIEDFGHVVVRTERQTDRLRAKHIQEACDEAIETLVLHGSYAIAQLPVTPEASE